MADWDEDDTGGPGRNPPGVGVPLEDAAEGLRRIATVDVTANYIRADRITARYEDFRRRFPEEREETQEEERVIKFFESDGSKLGAITIVCLAIIILALMYHNSTTEKAFIKAGYLRELTTYCSSTTASTRWVKHE